MEPILSERRPDISEHRSGAVAPASAAKGAGALPEVRLSFERGAVLLRGARPIDAAGLPGTTWDFEAQAFRAPAMRHGDLLDALATRRVRVIDRAREGGPAPRAFTPPGLRPSERAHLDAWERAGRRGLMVVPPGAARRRIAFAAIARTCLRALCIVPARPELLVWSAAFARAYGEKVAELGDAPRHEITPVSIATLGVAHRRMCELGALFDLLIADEAQDLAAGARGRPMDESIARARLGFLGGPPRQGSSLARLIERLGPVLAAPPGAGDDVAEAEEDAGEQEGGAAGGET